MSTEDTLKQILETQKEILEKFKRQEDKLDDINKKIKEQDQRISKIEQKVDDTFTNVISEMELRNKKRSNIVIYGLREDGHDDKETVKSFLTKSFDVIVDVQRTVRFGSKEGAPKVVKAILSEQQATQIFTKYDAMRAENKRQKLGESVFIERDLTKLQVAEKRTAMDVKNDLKRRDKKSVIRFVNGQYKCFEIKE